MAVALDIAGAEKKLRQAEFFLGQLQHATEDYQAHWRGEAKSEHLEFYFSACLTAAQSVFYILDGSGGNKFKKTQRDWRMGLKSDAERHRFNDMIGRRDSDVHYGKTGAKPLPKYIKDDPLRNRSPYASHSFVFPAVFLGPAPVMEEENPDGTKVSGSTLLGTVGLFLDRDGATVETTTACRDFIDQLRSLLEATKAAFQPEPPI
jgi:hypothetical protein